MAGGHVAGVCCQGGEAAAISGARVTGLTVLMVGIFGLPKAVAPTVSSGALLRRTGTQMRFQNA